VQSWGKVADWAVLFNDKNAIILPLFTPIFSEIDLFMDKVLIQLAKEGDKRSIARCISLIENQADGYKAIIASLSAPSGVPVIGITGPPGAGKSTLVDGLIGVYVEEGKKIAVVCVDPSSPFHQGAVLGDRIRMSGWYNHPAVYIRSLATRGATGGLNPAVDDIIACLKSCGFDLIILETVGVGQSEVGVAKLADLSVVVLVPEAGDEIQFMKAGLMEVADIFVVNKSDRTGADLFSSQLKNMLHVSSSTKHKDIQHVVNTVATTGVGIAALKNIIDHLIIKP
jgi:LAO/AO transport system kinase